MSRLSRAIVRRDKAYQLLESVESQDQETQQLNHMDRLTAILRDIDPNKIGPIPKNFKKRKIVKRTQNFNKKSKLPLFLSYFHEICR